MSVRGSLRTMPAEDLLDWIDRRFMSGALTVERSSIVREFLFESGTLTAASSNEPHEHIDQILTRAGLIDDELLSGALQMQVETGMTLSRIFEIVGAVTEEQLRRILEERAREGLLDVMSWPDGTFLLDRVFGEAAVTEAPLSLKLRPCIEEGRRRARRWSHIRALIPSGDTRLRVIARERLFSVADSEAIRNEIAALCEAVDAGKTPAEIVAERGYRFAVLDRLTLLIERGALAADEGQDSSAEEPEPVGPSSIEELLAEAKRRADMNDRSSAFDLARQALVQDPSNNAVQKLFRELERAVFAELSRELLTTFRVPKLLVDRSELDNYELTDAERYLAGRIDGRWDLLSLMRVSPLGEVEALITFKRLADRGIISLS